MSTEKSDQSSITPSSGKLIPPAHPVDVPNLPEKPASTGKPVGKGTTQPDGEVHAETSQPADIDHSRSSWADSTQPAPDKRNARTSIL